MKNGKERHWINVLVEHLKDLERQQQIEPKVNWSKKQLQLDENSTKLKSGEIFFKKGSDLQTFVFKKTKENKTHATLAQ